MTGDPLDDPAMSGRDWLLASGGMLAGFFLAMVVMGVVLILFQGGWVLLIIGFPILLLQIIFGGLLEWVAQKTVFRKQEERERHAASLAPVPRPWLVRKSVWIGAAIACVVIAVQNFRIHVLGA